MRISTVTIHDGSGIPGLGERMAGSLQIPAESREWPGADAGPARIYDVGVPFGRQPRSGAGAPLYDGYALQGIVSDVIAEPRMDALHVVFLDKLACTFDPGDHRYHARALIASNPAIVSVPGITEAPARPRGYYVDMACCSAAELEARYAGTYLEAGDPGVAGAAEVYLAQAVAYWETGEAFCTDPGCRLYNAHWQSELLSQVKSPRFCKRHRALSECM